MPLSQESYSKETEMLMLNFSFFELVQYYRRSTFKTTTGAWFIVSTTDAPVAAMVVMELKG